MVCFNPNQGFERKGITANGKFTFTYSRLLARCVNGVPVPMTTICHTCDGCRNDYAREWATKICLEAQMHKDTSFITLTYNDDFIPAFGALSYQDHWRKFLDRFRLAIRPISIRYYMIGEYGDLNLRPHYHAIIFGYSFPDRYIHMWRNGLPIYRSSFLESLWTVPRGELRSGESFGYSSVGDVDYYSAAYVARYSMKKQTYSAFDGFEEVVHFDSGEVIEVPKPSSRYVRYHPETGDKIVVPRERALMSNGSGSGQGGIGKPWFDKFSSDMFPKDLYHMPGGRIVRPPKYFDKLLERGDPQMLERVKLSRQDHMSANACEFTPERLAQRQECFKRKMQLYRRDIRRVYDVT